MAQAAAQLLEAPAISKDELFRRAQARAFRHMSSIWYGPDKRRAIREGIEQIIRAGEDFVGESHSTPHV